MENVVCLYACKHSIINMNWGEKRWIYEEAPIKESLPHLSRPFINNQTVQLNIARSKWPHYSHTHINVLYQPWLIFVEWNKNGTYYSYIIYVKNGDAQGFHPYFYNILILLFHFIQSPSYQHWIFLHNSLLKSSLRVFFTFLFCLQKLLLADNGEIFNLWKSPPVNLYIKIYLFNITNVDAFLRGEEKMRVEEVGPYVYR